MCLTTATCAHYIQITIMQRQREPHSYADLPPVRRVTRYTFNPKIVNYSAGIGVIIISHFDSGPQYINFICGARSIL
jgi:hypothetical protein